MGINKKGFWSSGSDPKNYSEGTDTTHCYDPSLAKALLDFLKNEDTNSVVDFGCGLGDYTKFFNNNGLNTKGFDGNPDTPSLTNNTCDIMDLSEPNKLDTKFDWALCLEVGEHIPKEYESIFVKNLDYHNLNGIILSWAVIGQSGDGHVNCQNNDYVKELFNNLGYTSDDYTEFLLRTYSTLPWFKNTIMVFRK